MKPGTEITWGKGRYIITGEIITRIESDGRFKTGHIDRYDRLVIGALNVNSSVITVGEYSGKILARYKQTFE
jgi:hypothetical protein